MPIIAPPTVIEPSPMDNVVEGMAATKIEISPPLAQPKKVWFMLSKHTVVCLQVYKILFTLYLVSMCNKHLLYHSTADQSVCLG